VGKRPRLPRELERVFWQGIRAGLKVAEAAGAAGASKSWGWRVFNEAGGVMPTRAVEPSGRYLCKAERDELAALHHGGLGVREIARRLGRDPGTVSRELKRGGTSRGYRPAVGQEYVDGGRSKPRSAKLATNLRLRREVQQGLRSRLSPEQIAGRLVVDFPDDLEMRVSPETIYQSLYVQSRGGLNRELTRFLRTGRSVRKPHRRSDERRGRIPGMVSISERPPEVEDRAVPGHWEGDLIMGAANRTAIVTLVERTSRSTLLGHLPGGRHDSATVKDAVIAALGVLPPHLRRTLTWDQGKEMALHPEIAAALGMTTVYFCDPRSPWQRPTNENTNGLLRQYFPKGTDLSRWSAEDLEAVALTLNNRPRKILGWKTPAEVFEEQLRSLDQGGVATTP